VIEQGIDDCDDKNVALISAVVQENSEQE